MKVLSRTQVPLQRTDKSFNKPAAANPYSENWKELFPPETVGLLDIVYVVIAIPLLYVNNSSVATGDYSRALWVFCIYHEQAVRFRCPPKLQAAILLAKERDSFCSKCGKTCTASQSRAIRSIIADVKHGKKIVCKFLLIRFTCLINNFTLCSYYIF